MGKEHTYRLTITWTGNTGNGTAGYRSYERSHIISADNKPDIAASSDPSFRGDGARYNPEELLVASLSGCHMLWFLHLCADQGIIITSYTDSPTGVMTETPTGRGKFKEVILNPVVGVSEASMLEMLAEIHEKAHQMCFIANSVNFPVRLRPSVQSPA
jgi:organic hydroperoxide reductase OsmC/OhrA